MKNLLKSLPLLFVGVLCLSTTVSAVESFEGKVAMQMKTGKDTQLVNYSIKPGFMRMDMAMDKDQTMTGIMDVEKKEMRMLIPGQQMYMVISLAEAADTAKSARDQMGDGGLQKTGETEKILGYTAEKYVSKDKNGTSEIWATQGLGVFYGAMSKNAMKPAARNQWEVEMMDKGYFPLRVVSKNKSGKETMRMEATSVQKQSLPASLFQTPAGYQRFEMGGLLKSAMGGLNPFGGK